MEAAVRTLSQQVLGLGPKVGGRRAVACRWLRKAFTRLWMQQLRNGGSRGAAAAVVARQRRSVGKGERGSLLCST